MYQKLVRADLLATESWSLVKYLANWHHIASGKDARVNRVLRKAQRRDWRRVENMRTLEQEYAGAQQEGRL